MNLSEFDYHLPKTRIAQYPSDERDSSRLLVLNKKNKEIRHSLFKNIVECLNEGDILVLNDTRVIPARMFGAKPSGGKVELLLVKELDPNRWEVMVKGLKNGAVIFENGVSGHIASSNGTVTLTSDRDIKELFNEIGVMPLPPYIKRPADQADVQRYQTVYAQKDGAIAAPTAGLHFTGELLDRIREKGVVVEKLTLHVGCGTFKPVLCEDIAVHEMGEECYEISNDTANEINRAKAESRRIIAVGTTVTRALEGSVLNRPDSAIISGMGKTSIFIYPGYKFRVIDALITNFHLPKSTPLMLTSAFSGLELLREAYAGALNADYRFFSYGDAMFIM